MITQKKEVVVGKEEGPSEAVSTNELVVRPGEKPVKQEIIEEEREMEENLAVDIVEAVPGDLPPAEPVAEAEEVLEKQEWVELCEQRRLPIKQKYQLQYNLKLELTK